MGPGEQENVFDEDYEPEWMRNDTQNYAIGRRIYDKNEIEVVRNVLFFQFNNCDIRSGGVD